MVFPKGATDELCPSNVVRQAEDRQRDRLRGHQRQVKDKKSD